MKLVDGKIHIYDISIDEFREIMPGDVESLEWQAAATCFMITGLRKLLERALLIGQGMATLNDFPEGR